MKKLIFNSVMLIFAAGLQAQNQRQDLLNMYRKLLGSDSYSLQLHYSLYLDGNLTKPYQQRQTLMLRQGVNMYLSQNSGIEVVETAEYGIVIDHRSHKLSARRYESSPKERESDRKILLDAMGKGHVDSLLAQFTDIRILSETATLRRYECTGAPTNPIEIMWLEVDKAKGIYNSMTVRYRQKEKIRSLDNQLHTLTLKIDYKNFNPAPRTSAGLFVPSTYLRSGPHGVTGPSSRFKNYTYSDSTR